MNNHGVRPDVDYNEDVFEFVNNYDQGQPK